MLIGGSEHQHLGLGDGHLTAVERNGDNAIGIYPVHRMTVAEDVHGRIGEVRRVQREAQIADGQLLGGAIGDAAGIESHVHQRGVIDVGNSDRCIDDGGGGIAFREVEGVINTPGTEIQVDCGSIVGWSYSDKDRREVRVRAAVICQVGKRIRTVEVGQWVIGERAIGIERKARCVCWCGYNGRSQCIAIGVEIVSKHARCGLVLFKTVGDKRIRRRLVLGLDPVGGSRLIRDSDLVNGAIQVHRVACDPDIGCGAACCLPCIECRGGQRSVDVQSPLVGGRIPYRRQLIPLPGVQADAPRAKKDSVAVTIRVRITRWSSC